MRADIRGDDLVFARLVTLALLSAAAVPSARAKEASPQMVLCHDHATKKYIADFRQVGTMRTSLNDEAPTVVTVFQNDSLRYEDYFSECMKRENRETAR
jgi:hypothetical protein